MSREAMKLALEALEWNMDYLPSQGHGASMARKAITALREALAEQPAQQRSISDMKFGGCPFCGSQSCVAGQCQRPAQPKQDRSGCTAGKDEECTNRHCATKCPALTPQPAQQEPVGEVSGHDWSTGLLYRDLEPGAPLYTSPPAQRKPLTDDVASELIQQDSRMEDEFNAAMELIRRTEAAHGIKENT